MMKAARELKRTFRYVRGFLPLIVGLLIWELTPSSHGSPFFPAPSDWPRALQDVGVAQIVRSLSETLRILLIGLLVATIAGSLLGITIGFFRTVRLSLSTTLEFLRALPSPVIVPIAVLAFGQTTTTKVFVVAFASVWPILLNAASASGLTSRVLLDVAQTFHLRRIDQVRKIVVPSAIPAILLGMRVALPIALILTILMEMLGSGKGVGLLLIEAQREYRSAAAFGLLFVVGIFGYALNLLFSMLESLLLRRWPEGAA